MIRVVQVNFVRPAGHSDPDRLLAEWPTLIDIGESVTIAGAEVTLVQSFGRDATIERKGVTCRFVAERTLPSRATGLEPRKLARAVFGIDPQVIHVNGLDFPLHTRAMCSSSVPVLVQDHGSRPGGRWRRRQWGLRRIAGAAFTSSKQAEPFVAEGSLAQDVPVFSVPESSTRFTFGDKSEALMTTGLYGEPAILWVGRLDRNKDPLTMLDAVEMVATQLPGLQLWCCFHEQPLLEQVKARIDSSPMLAERVHLLGKVPHNRIEMLCRASDIFVSSSHHEGSGYALIEALACGVTPVVSEIAPFQALAGIVGEFARPGDANAFARALTNASRRIAQEKRREILDYFRENLSLECVGRRLREIYSSLAIQTG